MDIRIEPYYPRMTRKVKRLLAAVRVGDIRKDNIRPGDKAMMLALIWDGWVTVLDMDHEMCPTHLEPGDLALTTTGRAWLEREMSRENT